MSLRETFVATALLVGSPARAADDDPCGARCGKHEEHEKTRFVGGHIGAGVQFWDAGTEYQAVIGRDFGVVGIVAGVNVPIHGRWSADFEFIVNADFRKANDPEPRMAFVLDPGIKYNWGHFWTGLRLAMRVPSPLGAEFGLIPIVGTRVPVKGSAAWYIELDLPLFVGGDPSFQSVGYVQTGLAF
jgi:hypothetical protein